MSRLFVVNSNEIQVKKAIDPSRLTKKAIAREANKLKSRTVSAALLFKINEKLLLDWSPEQIAGYYEKRGENRLSQEFIYQYIWRDKAEGGLLYKHLRRSGLW